jgi:hypothetical protein
MCNLKTLHTSSTSFTCLCYFSLDYKKQKGPETQSCPGEHSLSRRVTIQIVIFLFQGQLKSDCDFWFAMTITIQIVISIFQGQLNSDCGFWFALTAKFRLWFLVCKDNYNSDCDFWFARTVKIRL